MLPFPLICAGDQVNLKYQKTTFKSISTSNSTIGEIRWKESCEKQLAQIERDIARLSVKAPIYVVDDADAAAFAASGAGAGGATSSSAGGAMGGAGGASGGLAGAAMGAAAAATRGASGRR